MRSDMKIEVVFSYERQYRVILWGSAYSFQHSTRYEDKMNFCAAQFIGEEFRFYLVSYVSLILHKSREFYVIYLSLSEITRISIYLTTQKCEQKCYAYMSMLCSNVRESNARRIDFIIPLCKYLICSLRVHSIRSESLNEARCIHTDIK